MAVKFVDMASEESTHTCSQSAEHKWLKFDYSSGIADVRLVLCFPIC
jgi:hypothetical protein